MEKEMATHSTNLAWRIPWTKEPGGLRSMELQKVRHNWVTKHFTFSFHPVGEGNCSWTVPQLELVRLFCKIRFIWVGSQFNWNLFFGELILVGISGLAGICSVVFQGKFIYLSWKLVHLCISTGLCVICVRICLHLLCFGAIKLIKMGNISSIPKQNSLGHILDTLRSEEQWPLNGS